MFSKENRFRMTVVVVMVLIALFISIGINSLREKVQPCTTNYTGSGEESVTVCDGQTETWVKVPAQLSCPTGRGGMSAPVCYNGFVKVEDIGDFILKTSCPGDSGDVVEYWHNHAADKKAAAAPAPNAVVPVDIAPDAPKFVKEMDSWWGESGRGGRYAAWERRLAWGTATVAGKKALWYAWSNTDAGVTTWFNVVIPKSGMKVCRAPLGTYEGEAGYDCFYSRPLRTGEENWMYVHDPKGMERTSIFNSIHTADGNWWLDTESAKTDWGEGDGKLAAAALAAQIQRDFPAVKQMKVRQLLK